MDKINKNRSSFKKLKDSAAQNQSRKMSKNLNYKTPKYIESVLDHKNHHFSKVKSMQFKEHKESMRETAPVEIFLSSNFITEHLPK